MADNIGGIVSAEYCPVENVTSCGVTSSGIILAFNKSNPWITFPQNSLGKVNLSVKKNDSDMYDVSGEIRCPAHLFNNQNEMTRADNKRALLRITYSDGRIYIIGSKENPVKIKADILTPSTASDFNGMLYTVSGTQTHPQLPQL